MLVEHQDLPEAAVVIVTVELGAEGLVLHLLSPEDMLGRVRTYPR